MDDVSIGPDPKNEQPVQKGVDAQSETERDIEIGFAGAEAKPFASSPQEKDAVKSVSKHDEEHSSADGHENLIADRRNAGRE
jgi:hypothetical protein